MMDPKDVGQWQHEEFYRYIAQAHDKPRYTLHYKTDAPLSIRSIFYVPETVSAGLAGHPQHAGAARGLSAAPSGEHRPWRSVCTTSSAS